MIKARKSKRRKGCISKAAIAKSIVYRVVAGNHFMECESLYCAILSINKKEK